MERLDATSRVPVQVVQAPEPTTIPYVLHVSPEVPLSERGLQGQPLGAATRRIPGLRSVSPEEDFIIDANLRADLRAGAEQKLTEQLDQIEAQVPQVQRAAWNNWLQEWRQAESGPFPIRLFVLGTLFFRVMQPARKAPMSAEAKSAWEALILALRSTLQQFLPRGKQAKDFLRICHLSWQTQNREQNVTLGQIIARIYLLPLSQESQQRLGIWIQDLLKISEENIPRQVRHCAGLIICFLNALVATLSRPQQHILAESVIHLRAWIASRLPPETSLEVFLQRCRDGIVQGAVTGWYTTQIQHTLTEQRSLMQRDVEHLQRQRQADRDDLVGAMSDTQQQRRQQILGAADSIQQLAGELRQEITAFQASTQRTYHLARTEEAAQSTFDAQLRHLQDETTRL